MRAYITYMDENCVATKRHPRVLNWLALEFLFTQFSRSVGKLNVNIFRIFFSIILLPLSSSSIYFSFNL